MEDAPLSENNEAELEQSADGEQPVSFDRDAMMDQYISLKAREEELDAKISDMETERTNIADQIAELQANMNAIIDRKEDLEREQARVRAEKKKLQVQLNEDEHLDFGFEAGRRMEIKRQRKD
jgi:predicted nuclease with TOPRIM domain